MGGPPVGAVDKKRLEAQLLGVERVSTTEGVLERLLAVQAQDQRGARLAIRARSTVAAATDVDDALTHRRSAVVTWLNRGTLHLVRTEDYYWLHPLTAPARRRESQRRLHQAGLEPTDVVRGLDIIVQSIHTDGPRTRRELGTALDAAGIRTGGQALIHLLFAASLEGLVVRGPVRRGEWAYVEVGEWLGPGPGLPDPTEALARLARRYLEGHGPAAAVDLARWAGITLGQARLGLGALEDRLTGVGERLVELATAGPAPRRVPPPRLLGAFDPLLHGWVDRTPLVGSHRGIVTINGIFRPTALVGGRVVGTWVLRSGAVELDLLEPVSARDGRSLGSDGRAVLEFLGLDQTRPTRSRSRAE